MSLHFQGADKYSPDRLNDLQRHVATQAAQGFYDRDANLALLRLYNFETELVHVQTVANVLIMALMQLPEADFTMLLHLIPENIQAEPLIGAVISLDRHLEGFRFAQFWSEVDRLRDILNPINGFYEAVRRYILQSISTTFQTLSRASLSQSLKSDGATLDNMIADKIASSGWNIGQDNVIRFPKRRMQQAQPQAQKPAAQFEKLLPVLKLAA
jgi:translation initiation factor 3 subunit K